MLKGEKISGVEETSQHVTALLSAGRRGGSARRGPSREGIVFSPL